MCRRLKPKPPTTQPWRNLPHLQPDSNQPASEESGTVHFSSRANLLRHNKLSLIRSTDGSLKMRKSGYLDAPMRRTSAARRDKKARMA
jgi:hypothetical protein